MSALLPPGWETWPRPAKERLLAALQARADAAGYVPWSRLRRPDQTPPPGSWYVWLLLGGRGSGKTRTGAETVHDATQHTDRIALVAPTAADARDVMVEGESGLLATARPGQRPTYEPSKRRVTWPNGAQAFAYSADEPDRLRGPQHGYAWCDEVAAWRRLDATWANLEMGLRLGQDPRIVATTTPRVVPWVRAAVKDPRYSVVRASTYANLANLAPTFRATVLAKYEGTRLGRQELHAEVLEDVDGALWGQGMIDRERVAALDHTSLARIVVAIDPAATSGPDSDETGIVVVGVSAPGRCPECGLLERGTGPHVFVLDDRSGRYSPDGWANQAVAAYERWGADAVVAETNQGGEMVGAVLRTVDRTVRYRPVTATRGKHTRAEPVAALYEQGKVHHVGTLTALEDQMTTWVPGLSDSPDRVDALVWGVTDAALATRSRGIATVA